MIGHLCPVCTAVLRSTHPGNVCPAICRAASGCDLQSTERGGFFSLLPLREFLFRVQVPCELKRRTKAQRNHFRRCIKPLWRWLHQISKYGFKGLLQQESKKVTSRHCFSRLKNGYTFKCTNSWFHINSEPSTVMIWLIITLQSWFNKIMILPYFGFVWYISISAYISLDLKMCKPSKHQATMKNQKTQTTTIKL